jgi:RHS repeat-associated protein
VFNKNMTTAQHGYVMVDPNDKGAWQKLELEVPIEENGYIYIYVANESMDNVDVYFDDVLARRNNCEGGEVQLIDAPLTSASDYYPFGLAMAGRSYSSEKYRFGYQGQFAELDEETGWNSFELRMWGAVIGRWIEIDPARQFMSPYLGKGNSPVNGIDPDGRDWFTNGTWTIFQRGQSELSANVSEQYGGGFMNIGADNMYKERDFQVTITFMRQSGSTIGCMIKVMKSNRLMFWNTTMIKRSHGLLWICNIRH